MASRRHKRGRRGGEPKASGPGVTAGAAAPLQPPKPFHTPFRDLAATLAARPAPLRSAANASPRLASASQAAGSASPANAAPGAIATKTPSSLPVPESEVTDEEILAASLAGVERLAPLSSRVRIRRRPDLSHIEAKRREDVEAMARAEGFHIAHEDRYVRGRAAGVSLETLARLEKGEFRICAHLDLHRMPLEDARRAVDEFLATQQKKGHRCVLIVTGKGKNSPRGEGVLREQVPQWLARGPSSRRVLAFASARPCDGGLGALVVLMRSGSSSKNRIEVEHGGVGPLES